MLAVALVLAAAVAGSAAALTPVAPPDVTGAAVVGETLTASSGGWLGTPATVTYQWERCDRRGQACVAIVGAASSTYAPSAADVGSTLRMLVTADGTPAQSGPSAAVAASPPPPPTATTSPSSPPAPSPALAASLAIAQTPTRTPAGLGDATASTIGLELHDSIADAAGATLHVLLSGGLQPVSASTDRGACTIGQLILCSLGTMSAGDTVRASLTVRPVDVGPQTIGALLSYDGINVAPDDELEIAVPGLPDVNLYAGFDASATAKVGRNVTYAFTLRNGGPQAASPVGVLVDVAPAATIRSTRGLPCTIGKGSVTCVLPTLPSQRSRKLTLVLRFRKPGPYMVSLRAAPGSVSRTQPPLAAVATVVSSD